MLPLGPESFTGGFTGAQLADHFGGKPRVMGVQDAWIKAKQPFGRKEPVVRAGDESVEGGGRCCRQSNRI
jgi:hypothetical protein